MVRVPRECIEQPGIAFISPVYALLFLFAELFLTVPGSLTRMTKFTSKILKLYLIPTLPAANYLLCDAIIAASSLQSVFSEKSFKRRPHRNPWSFKDKESS
jgi:hypothetical protein